MADLTVWDRLPTNVACPDMLIQIPRGVSMRFSVVGHATFRVRREGKSPSTGAYSVTVIEKTVVVR